MEKKASLGWAGGALGREAGRAAFSIVGPKAIILSDREVPVATPEKRNQPVLTFPLNR